MKSFQTLENISDSNGRNWKLDVNSAKERFSRLGGKRIPCFMVLKRSAIKLGILGCTRIRC
jgi:hypothetical protein